MSDPNEIIALSRNTISRLCGHPDTLVLLAHLVLYSNKDWNVEVNTRRIAGQTGQTRYKVEKGLELLSDLQLISQISAKNQPSIYHIHNNLGANISQISAKNQPSFNQSQPLIPIPESDSLTSFADIFNSKVEGTRIPRIRGLSDTRKRALKNLAKEYGAVALESILDKVVASDFLSGRKTDFCASFDWIYKKANFLKIYEGNYDNTIRTSGFIAVQTDRYSELERAADTVLFNAPHGKST